MTAEDKTQAMKNRMLATLKMVAGILCLLNKEGGLNAREIARRLSVPYTTINHALYRLEIDRLITSCPNLLQMHSNQYFITETGQKLLADPNTRLKIVKAFEGRQK